MTPISHEPTPVPDPHEQTEALRAALDSAIASLEAGGVAPSDMAVPELRAMRIALTDPPEGYPGLEKLDSALTETIRSMADLAACADPEEVQQSLKTLRRILLIDRRTDPDPETGSLCLAIALRRLWLIRHRAGLLKAQKQRLQVSRRISDPALKPSELPPLQETLSLLEQYIAAQEGYGASVRQELEDLNARRLT